MAAPTTSTERTHATALAESAAEEVRQVQQLLAQLAGGIRAVRDKLGEKHPLHAECVALQHRFAEALAQANKAVMTIHAVRMTREMHTLIPLDATDLELHPLHPDHCRGEQPPKYRDWRSAAANDLRAE
jgi:hypothetical protein